MANPLVRRARNAHLSRVAAPPAAPLPATATAAVATAAAVAAALTAAARLSLKLRAFSIGWVTAARRPLRTAPLRTAPLERGRLLQQRQGPRALEEPQRHARRALRICLRAAQLPRRAAMHAQPRERRALGVARRILRAKYAQTCVAASICVRRRAVMRAAGGTEPARRQESDARQERTAREIRASEATRSRAREGQGAVRERQGARRGALVNAAKAAPLGAVRPETTSAARTGWPSTRPTRLQPRALIVC
eukprot:2816331-Pleurochrysis_carterae.AAC.1